MIVIVCCLLKNIFLLFFWLTNLISLSDWIYIVVFYIYLVKTAIEDNKKQDTESWNFG